MEQLKKSKVSYKVKHLEVGDFLWMLKTPLGEELVLDYIIERKRMDDLEGSIVDKRYGNQKERMKLCGLRNLIYLVESYGNEMLFKSDLSDQRKKSLGELRSKINDTQVS